MKQSVYIFGWSTIVVSVILILSQFMNLAITGSVDQVVGLFGSYPGLKSTALGPMVAMFTYSRIWSVYSIVYFALTCTGGIQFVQFKEGGRRILEIACWIGLLNACVDTVVSYSLWNRMDSAMRVLTGGIGVTVERISPYGLGAIIVGFFIWVVPSIGIIFYLRRPALRSLMVAGRSLDGPQATVHREIADP